MMKPEAQRIAIAEACGWRFIEDAVSKGPDAYEGTHSGEAWLKPGQEWDKWEWWQQREIGFKQTPPNYTSDLNAMHEAEKVLTIEQQRRYAAELGRSYDGSFLHVTATTSQRAEAFLRTIGKWEGE